MQRQIAIDRVKPMRIGNEPAFGVASLPSDESPFTSSCKPIP